jgi:hypothetical protein
MIEYKHMLTALQVQVMHSCDGSGQQQQIPAAIRL